MEKSIEAVGKERRIKKLKKREKSGLISTENRKGTVQVEPTNEQHPGQEALPIRKKTAKTGPTTNRISGDQKQALTNSGRALYIALPKSLKIRKSAAQTALKPFLASLQLRGLKAVSPSGNSFYAALFESEDRRDRAATKIRKAVFKWEGVPLKLTVHNFGENPGTKDVIIQTSANLLADGEAVTTSIVEHYLAVDPLYKGPFIVRQIMDNDMPSGKWAIKFEGKGPDKFSKQMKMGSVTVLLTQEPNNTCRFCSQSGHSIFECTMKGEKELGNEVFKGMAGITPNTGEVLMEE